MRDMQCTCPHSYTDTGLQRYATDALCPVHGAPKAPETVDSPTIAEQQPCISGHRYDDGVCVQCLSDEPLS
jgi:hypothetical protein